MSSGCCQKNINQQLAKSIVLSQRARVVLLVFLKTAYPFVCPSFLPLFLMAQKKECYSVMVGHYAMRSWAVAAAEQRQDVAKTRTLKKDKDKLKTGKASHRLEKH